jgi:nicotinamidase-related amidase
MSHPDFYDPQQIGDLFYPDMAAITAAAAAADLPPAAGDAHNTLLLLIDMQVDFCHENGTLYVPGAPGDIKRVIEFMFRYGRYITRTIATLDSHLPFQIFHAAWWADAEGNHPQPLTIITAEDVDDGTWRPLVMPEFSRRYVHRLEEKSKKQLTIWPYHVLIGGMGAALDPSLWSALMWHALARKTQPTWLLKGRVPQSEYYSAVQPEIDVPGHPQGVKQQGFLDAVAEADTVLVAGEAESHCVLETLSDIVAEFDDRPQQLQKIYVLQDCTSPVQHPDVDFHALAQEQFAEFAGQGVNFVDSSEEEWPFLAGETAVVADPAPVTDLDTMGDWQKAQHAYRESQT